MDFGSYVSSSAGWLFFLSAVLILGSGHLKLQFACEFGFEGFGTKFEGIHAELSDATSEDAATGLYGNRDPSLYGLADAFIEVNETSCGLDAFSLSWTSLMFVAWSFDPTGRTAETLPSAARCRPGSGGIPKPGFGDCCRFR